MEQRDKDDKKATTLLRARRRLKYRVFPHKNAIPCDGLRIAISVAKLLETSRKQVILRDSKLLWGGGGRWFKSSRPDFNPKQLVAIICGELFLVCVQSFT
jgi:hypothetical protein